MKDVRINSPAFDKLRMRARLDDAAIIQNHNHISITDGGDTASSNRYADALRAAEAAETIVYSVIIVPIEASAGRDTGGEHALIQISTDTGGKYYYATSLAQLDEAFRKISEELRTQYLLAYYSSKRYSDSDFRKVEIKLNGSAAANYRARHRAGYPTAPVTYSPVILTRNQQVVADGPARQAALRHCW